MMEVENQRSTEVDSQPTGVDDVEACDGKDVKDEPTFHTHGSSITMMEVTGRKGRLLEQR